MRTTTLALTVALTTLACGGQDPPSGPAPASAPVPVPPTRVEVGAGPSSIAGAYGAVWSADHGGDTISRIDPRAMKVTATHRVAGEPTGIAAGFGSLWTFTPMPPGPAVQRIDPRTGEVLARIRLRGAGGGPMQGIARAAGAMWIAADDGYLTRIDPRSNRARRVLRLPKADFACPGALAVARGALWFAPECGGPRVLRIDPRRREVTDRIRVREDYAVAVTAGGGFVWALTSNGSVLKIDPLRRQVIARARVADAAERATYGGGALWVRADAERLVRVDPRALEATRAHRLPEATVPGGPVAFAAGDVWAGNFGEGTVWRLRP